MEQVAETKNQCHIVAWSEPDGFKFLVSFFSSEVSVSLGMEMEMGGVEVKTPGPDKPCQVEEVDVSMTFEPIKGRDQHLT